jgi:hypothetical protein
MNPRVKRDGGQNRRITTEFTPSHVRWQNNDFVSAGKEALP